MKKFLIAFCFLIQCLSVNAQDTTRLSLLFLGDIMQHDSQISDAWDAAEKKYNYLPCFQYLKPYTQAADLTIANLELTLAGPPYKGYPQFSAPDELLVGLQDMGIDIMVTANNHCVDKGRHGLERTIQMLDSFKIPHTGTFVDEVSKLNEHPLLIQRNNFKLAILNYTFSTNGLPVTSPNIVNMIDTAAMRADLQKTKKLNQDAIIVFVHWGREYESLPTAWQKTVTEYCFKHGANLVIGAHPHVIQPMEWDKDKNQLVAYSLGNFVSGQRKRYTDGGAMINVELEKISYGNSTEGYDSAITKIDTANYILQWIYKTEIGKNYYMIPVQKFENDTTGLIADAESKAAFKLFAEDSRSLLGKHNKNIVESTVVPADSIVIYRVLFQQDLSDPEKGSSIHLSAPYGIEVVQQETGKVFYSGNFTRIEEAEKYVKLLREKLGMKEATLVMFVNGKRSDIVR